MRIAITALGLCLAAGPAFAQSSYNYRDRNEDRGVTYDSRSNDSRSYQSSSAHRSDDWNDDKIHRDERSPHARGAAFYLKSGDKEFRVDCGDEESTRECVDAALTIFREIQKPVSPTTSTSSSGAPGSSVTGSNRGAATGR